jgi:ATP-dependent Zn protease
LAKIPEKLVKETQKEANKRQQRQIEMNRRRDYSTISVYLGKMTDENKPWKLEISENFKIVTFNRNGDISGIAKVAATEWNINDKENSYRLRKYNTKYKVAVETLNSQFFFNFLSYFFIFYFCFHFHFFLIPF